MTGEEMLVALRREFRLLRDLPPSTYVVGGALRDLLVGATPGDLDFATADADALAGLLSRRSGSRPIRLGRDALKALRIVDAGVIYDVTPLTGQSIDLDLERRDFTINAIALDCATAELLDPFGGREAIEGRRLALVRESNLDDDPLRVIKAVRMAARYHLSIDEMTAFALRRRAASIADVAVERVHDELMAILGAPDLHRAIELLRRLDLDEVLFEKQLDPDRFPSLAGVRFQSSAALALIHRDTNGSELHRKARRWSWSIAEERRVSALLKEARAMIRGDEGAVVLHDAGAELAQPLVALLRALGETPRADALDAMVSARGAEIFAMQPLMGGDEIARTAGIEAGPAIGTLKRALLEAQLRGEVATRPEAETFVKDFQG
jgi:tRNA nucleotidyltransferase/poly(A) polymerase